MIGMWLPLVVAIATLPIHSIALISRNQWFIKEVNRLRAANETLNGDLPFSIPFHVSIQAREGYNSYKHLCGGTIIDRRIIMTAAHCFYENRPTRRLSVVAGVRKLSTAPTARRYRIARVLQHPLFVPLHGYDIALVKLRRRLRIDGTNLDTVDYRVVENVKHNEPAYLIGWGRKQNMLEIVDFRTVNLKECRQYGFPYVTDTDLCAYSQYGRGACDGDSGGALMSPNLTMQYGLLSYGRTICQKNRIYVYTSTFRLRAWIDRSIKKLMG